LWICGRIYNRHFMLCFQFLCQFPKRYIYIFPCFGKAMFAERKVLSSESARLSKKVRRVKCVEKRRESYEEQQSD